MNTLRRPRSGPDPLPLPAAVAPAAPRRKLKPWHWAPYVFISPFFILFAVFGLFPLLFSLVPPSPAGTRTPAWRDEARRHRQLRLRARRRVVLEVAVEHALAGPRVRRAAAPGGDPARLLHPHPFKRWRNAVLGAYFLPYITSTVAIALIFTTLFSTDFGVHQRRARRAAQGPGLGWLLPDAAIDWLGKAEYIKPAVALVVFWRYVGFNTRAVPGRAADDPEGPVRSRRRWTARRAGSSSATSRCRC